MKLCVWGDVYVVEELVVFMLGGGGGAAGSMWGLIAAVGASDGSRQPTPEAGQQTQLIAALVNTVCPNTPPSAPLLNSAPVRLLRLSTDDDDESTWVVNEICWQRSLNQYRDSAIGVQR